MAEAVSRDVAGEPWVPRGVRLLDVDPELAAELEGDELVQASEHAIVPKLRFDPGPWGPERLADERGVRGDAHGFLLLAGAVTIDVSMMGRSCTRLITPGELVLLDGRETDSIPLRWGWSVLEPATVAVLDDRLLAIGRRWPTLMAAILRRGAQQLRHALLQQAISQLPRVEDRLLGLIWSIADRQGVVRGDGIWVHLPVTHDTLAHMVGARRSTVSLGLTKLAHKGLLTPEAGGWLIDRASLDRFEFPGVDRLIQSVVPPLTGSKPASTG